jgi:F-type H+-transporting ATPase subunit b
MQLDIWTLLLQAINLAVLLALLRWALYKPLIDVIDARRKANDEQLAAAAAARAAAEQQADSLAKERAALDASRMQVLAQARKTAAQERDTARQQAKVEADDALAHAAVQIAREREDAAEAMLDEASQLAVSVATRLLTAPPAQRGDAGFVAALLDRLAATPADERAAWFDAAAPGKVTLVSAAALDEATRAHAAERLHALLGADVSLDTQVDPALIRGAELRFAHGVLALHWAAELAAARAQMQHMACDSR